MVKTKFLYILKSALEDKKVLNINLSTEEAEEILSLALLHKLLPLVYDCLCSTDNKDDFPHLRQKVKIAVSQQALRTEAFTSLYTSLKNAGLSPIAVKGIVCRSLYPKPDLRISADEDLLIPRDAYDKYKETLISLGFSPYREKAGSYQTSFIRADGFHIELHTSLFSLDSPYFSRWNDAFSEAFLHAIHIKANETEICTLSHTDHLLYLILHALKHFIHSGVGIRQVCDIIVFSQNYAESVDWNYIFEKCKEFGILKFALAVFAIGKKHLTSTDYSDKIPLPSPLPDESALLSDILCGGVYGNATLSRKHSGSITFSAAQKGKKQNLLKRIFPCAKSLSYRYSYAKRSSVLLPVAWGHRLLSYRKEVKNSANNSPSKAVETGNERIRLLKEYGIISN